MKKLGTPIGAGPGRAKEKLGLEGVGTPLLVRWGGGDEDLFFFFFLFLSCPEELPDPFAPTVPAGAGWLEGRWLLPGELGLGAVVVGVVEDGVVFDLLPEPPVGVVWEPVVVVVGVVLGVLVVGEVTVGVVVVSGGGQTLEISVSPTGSGAPGGSWSCTTWPVIVFTVTVQSAATASGIATKP